MEVVGQSSAIGSHQPTCAADPWTSTIAGRPGSPHARVKISQPSTIVMARRVYGEGARGVPPMISAGGFGLATTRGSPRRSPTSCSVVTARGPLRRQPEGGRQLGPARHADLGEDRLDVVADRVARDDQARRDLVGRQPGYEQLGDLALAVGQAVQGQQQRERARRGRQARARPRPWPRRRRPGAARRRGSAASRRRASARARARAGRRRRPRWPAPEARPAEIGGGSIPGSIRRVDRAEPALGLAGCGFDRPVGAEHEHPRRAQLERRVRRAAERRAHAVAEVGRRSRPPSGPPPR